MAFTVGSVLAKDSAGTAIPGGLLSADVAGGGVGPTFLFHGIVDGKAGVNKLGVFAEDAAHADGDTGLQLLTVRKNTAAALSGTDADYQPLITDTNGRLHVNVGAAADGAISTLGITTGAKVVTDADGTVQQYLRGLVSLFAAGLSLSGSVALAAGTAHVGSVTPEYTSSGITTLQSNATGTTYNAFSSQACKCLKLVNDTGVDLEVRQDAAGSTFIVWNGTVYEFHGITNASQVGYRRKDTSNTQVTLAAQWVA